MYGSEFFLPTRICFGAGKLSQIGEIGSEMGKRCLLVTGPSNSLGDLSLRAVDLLNKSGVEVFIFNGVVANPTQECVERGMNAAVEHGVDFVMGLGGGSVLDCAKTIALLFTSRGGIDWEFISTEFSDPFRNHPLPSPFSLPLIAVPTTSGTGSHVTQAAVITDTETMEKQTIFHPGNFPRLAIVDPELMVTVPMRVTAASGFDAFSHAFESYLGTRTTPITESMALTAMRMIFENLPKALAHPKDIRVRTNLAWADTLAGICLANGGASLPHPLGEIIGGFCPEIHHGETLAMVYPEFMRFILPTFPGKMAEVARAVKGGLEKSSDAEAAETFCSAIDEFLHRIDLALSMNTKRISEVDFRNICNSSALDRLGPDRKEEFLSFFHSSRKRVNHEVC